MKRSFLGDYGKVINYDESGNKTETILTDRQILDFFPFRIPRIQIPSRICVEFFSPNPVSEPHLGNILGLIFGSSISNILRIQGHYLVNRLYINDVSRQLLTLARWVDSGLGDGLQESDYSKAIVEIPRDSVNDRIQELFGDYALTITEYRIRNHWTDRILRVASERGVSFEEVVYESEEMYLRKLHGFLNNKYPDWLLTHDGNPNYTLRDYLSNLATFIGDRYICILGVDHENHIERMNRILSIENIPFRHDFILFPIVLSNTGKKRSKRISNMTFHGNTPELLIGILSKEPMKPIYDRDFDSLEIYGSQVISAIRELRATGTDSELIQTDMIILWNLLKGQSLANKGFEHIRPHYFMNYLKSICASISGLSPGGRGLISMEVDTILEILGIKTLIDSHLKDIL